MFFIRKKMVYMFFIFTVFFLLVSNHGYAIAEDSYNKNLLKNFDFSQYTNGSGVADGWSRESWDARSHNFEMIQSQSGKNIQKISGNGISKNNFVAISQMVQVEPNKPFLIKSRFNAESLSNAKVQMYVDFYKDAHHIIAINTTDSSIEGGFITHFNQGTIPKEATFAKIYLLIRGIQDNGAGIVNVDYIDFSYGTDHKPIGNSDFNAYTGKGGLADNWEHEKGGAESAQVEIITTSTGKKIQKLTGTGIKNTQFVSVNQTIKVEPNKPFYIQSKLNAENLSKAKVLLYVDFYKDWSHIVGSNITENKISNGGFITFSNKGVVPADASFAKIYALIRATDEGGSGTLYLDSINFNYGVNEELLYNSDFSTYNGKNEIADGWEPITWGWNGNKAAFKLLSASKGKRTQELSGSGIGSNGIVSVSQSIKLDPDKPFIIKGRFHTKELKSSIIQMYVDFYDSSNQTIQTNVTTNDVVSGGYITLSNYGKTPPNVSFARVHALIRAAADEGAGVLWVDSLSFTYGETNSLLVNPDFEFPLLGSPASGWQTYTSQGHVDESRLVTSAEEARMNQTRSSYDSSGRLTMVSYTNPHDKSLTGYKYDSNGNLLNKLSIKGQKVVTPVYQGLQAQKIASWWIEKDGYRGTGQDIHMEPNKPLSIKAAINVESLHHAKAQIYIDFYDKRNRIIDGEQAVADLTEVTGGSFKIVQIKKKTPADVSYARVYILLRGLEKDAAGSMFVDSVLLNYEE
ncbi:hypothetical protein [Paenibacillus chitinolyticus]|uniref:hypothetical protein n=1 Tax=Paenibacillus chitinolyticus TaxID=79263 RepID=UPI003CFF0B56